MSKADLKGIAQILFLEGYSQKEIAFKLGITEKTMSQWKKMSNWDTLKTNLLMSRDTRLAELYAELAEFNTYIKTKEVGWRFASSKEADARRKLITDIAELERKYNIGQCISIGRDFVNYAKDIDFEFSQNVLNYFDSFINHIIQKKKWQNE